MLDAMRQASQNWIGRTLMGLVMGLIVISFLIWGIGDIFRGFGGNSIARVGSIDITPEAYRTAYQNELQRLQQQARRPISAEQARAMGLDNQVLSRLISDTTLDDRAAKLGLAMSDAEIVKTALDEPAFRGATGKFDPLVFASVLRDNNLTEPQFVREQRGVYLRREIADAMVGGLAVPKVVLAAVNRFRNETRAIDYVLIDAKSVPPVAAPSADALQQFYDQRLLTWRAPAYRKIVLLALSPTSLSDPKAVTDATVQARYDQQKDRFTTPETRDVQQVLFPDEAAASAAAEKIKAGAKLETVAADAKLSVVDLGTVKRPDLFDKGAGDAAFALQPGQVSAPVKGQLGFLLVRASKITPAVTKPLSEVKDTLRIEIALEAARQKASTLRDQIEDQRASGRPLAEAAKAAGQTVRTLEALDATGRDKAGQLVDLPERDTVLKAVFASDIGVDNDLIATRDGGTIWFEIAGIEASRQKPLDEVKAEVDAAWRADELARVLAAKAQELVGQLDSGTTLAALAKSNGNTPVRHADSLKRMGAATLPPSVINAVFNVKNGSAGTAPGEGDTRVVFKVVASTVPPEPAAGDATTATITEQLRQQMTEDVLGLTLGQMQTALGVRINPVALRAAAGGGSASAEQ